MAMEQRLDVPQRIHTIRLRVPDLDAARSFYLHGMGWMPMRDTPEELVLGVGPGLRLALVAARDGPEPLTLVLHVEAEDEVVKVVELAGREGGTVGGPPTPTPSGGLHGTFADPAGFRWEVTTDR